MGLFKSIKKAFKKVFKGIKKVFKKVGKFVGKILNSKWGKILMTAAAIFTGGAALMAGIGNASAASGFIGKFVAGGKGFISGLLNPLKTMKGAAAGLQGGGGVGGMLEGAARGSGALTTLPQNAGQLLETGATDGVSSQAAEQAAEQAAATQQAAATGAEGAATGVEAAATGVDTSAKVQNALNMQKLQSAPTLNGGGSAAWDAATKFAGGAKDFLQTTGGGLLASNMVQGYSQGKAMEDQLKYGDHYDRQWADPRQQAILKEAAQWTPTTPGGFLSRAERFTNTAENYGSRVGYTKSSERGYAPAGGQ